MSNAHHPYKSYKASTNNCNHLPKVIPTIAVQSYHCYFSHSLCHLSCNV